MITSISVPPPVPQQISISLAEDNLQLWNQEVPVRNDASQIYACYGAEGSEARELIADLMRLKDGWFGEGSVAIDDKIIDRVAAALALISRVRNLPRPEVTPTANGTVSLEWSNDSLSIYLELGKTKMIGFLQGSITGLVPLDIKSLPISLFQVFSDLLNPQSVQSVSQEVARAE